MPKGQRFIIGGIENWELGMVKRTWGQGELGTLGLDLLQVLTSCPQVPKSFLPPHSP
ncbi:hypothetical protein [uncultured Nostoc sp.]|uniref:hypothetical protein n=1 Tax=uncultured Nostoc sp. TaxID=340711 RepID=UPI0035CC8254